MDSGGIIFFGWWRCSIWLVDICLGKVTQYLEREDDVWLLWKLLACAVSNGRVRASWLWRADWSGRRVQGEVNGLFCHGLPLTGTSGWMASSVRKCGLPECKVPMSLVSRMQRSHVLLLLVLICSCGFLSTACDEQGAPFNRKHWILRRFWCFTLAIDNSSYPLQQLRIVLFSKPFNKI